MPIKKTCDFSAFKIIIIRLVDVGKKSIICICLFLNALVISKTIRTFKYIEAGYTQEIVPIRYETIWFKN